ncbi:Anaphase-promoting complex subunit 2 [Candida viswanathii]|uniref:Anaphase-promoting complex subunit 2 n=1 Tax=Candida viswanathii TaxID=5486 RepID=A0A367XYJ8_9ASCO|nr:Anaphase-promoting complex subunit 2 [Candida viswanathii]
MQVDITKDLISSIISFPNLSDLSNSASDFDNDIQILLDWLHPHVPSSFIKRSNDGTPTAPLLSKFPEPLQRVKSAIRGCLKEEKNQLQFINLYINTINIKLLDYFSSLTNLSFLEYIDVIKILLHYYNSQFEYLNVTDKAFKIFSRKLSFIISSNLLDRTTFKSTMNQFFEESLFMKATLSNPMSTNALNLIDVISTLVSINMSTLLNEIVIKLSVEKIKQHTLSLSTGIWDKPLLGPLNSFIQDEIYPNFYIVISYTTSATLTDTMNNIYLYELVKIAHDELVSLRIKEIYSMILNYPNSQIALSELHYCLLKNKFNHQDYGISTNLLSYVTDLSVNSQAIQRTNLVERFIDYCNKNLLHAGANTIDVITTYAKTIRSFLIVDPKGVLLDKVVRPIRKYLKTREDIIIKLVRGLLDNSPDNDLIELAQELRSPSKYRSKSSHSKDILEDSLDLNWVPDPVDALPDFKNGKVSDIIESLISIFDSKEIFIDEFTRLFGEQLINLKNYDVEEIECNLNLLKARFGKQNFTTLDIMIRDIRESRSLNELLGGQDAVFNTSVLSHLYWPTVLDNIDPEQHNFKIPDEVEKKFQEFKSKFAQEKHGRTLKVVPSLGTVKLQLEFKNHAKEFTVSPDKAAIISLFNDQENELSVSHIAQALSMSEYMVSKGLVYWVKEGVLMELTKTLYIVNDDDEEDEIIQQEAEVDLLTNFTPSDNNPTAQSSAKFSEINVVEPYLFTMLQNITLLSFQRIKTLLNLMVPKDKLDLAKVSDNLLEEYLDSLVEESKIHIRHGNYSLHN